MDLKSFEQLLQRHDWYYYMAEGNGYWKGLEQSRNIKHALNTLWLKDPFEAEQAQSLYEEYQLKNPSPGMSV